MTAHVHRTDVPVEYSGEEQAICAVGLAKPRPGVFVAAIQHVLVLCTTVEVSLMRFTHWRGSACCEVVHISPAAQDWLHVLLVLSPV